MSYVLSEKQREYQRKWAQKRRDQKKLVATWEQLTRKWENVKTYGECVSKAQKFAFSHRGHRLDIAELCLRACVIKHGGDQRSDQAKESQRNTVTAFAKEIGINHKTLFNWIFVKTGIFDNLPQAHKKWGVNFGTARRAQLLSSKNGKDLIENYQELSALSPKRTTLLKRIDELRIVAGFFKKNETIFINTNDRRDMLRYLKVIKNVIS